MSRKVFFLLLMMFAMTLQGQNISVTFTGTGAATKIDNIIATNFTKNQNVSLPGNETLILNVTTGILVVSELTNLGIVFPNPFSGSATLTTIVQKPQTVLLKLQNLVGQVVAQTITLVQPGVNEFTLSVAAGGIYIVNLTTEHGTASYKVICSEATQSENRIQYRGTVPDNDKDSLQPRLKRSQTEYTLEYTVGDIIRYKCKSGIYTTILTDSPTSSKNYNVEFAACTDPDGKNYSIVKIGTQTWMADNLAYMPFLSSGVWVYDYEGLNISDAKASGDYFKYGCLYDWETANYDNFENSQDICPSGWHLPTDAEWTTLTDYLTNNGYGYGGSGSDIGKSMASTSGWTTNSDAGTIGNDQGRNNRSGFTALPGGFRSDGGFGNLGLNAFFWSSSEDGSLAWYRVLGFSIDGVRRVNYDRRSGFSVRCLKN